MSRIKEVHSYETQQILDFSKHTFALEKDYYLRNIELIRELDIIPIIKFDKKNQVVFIFKNITSNLIITSNYNKDIFDKCIFTYTYYRIKPNAKTSQYLYHKHPVIVEDIYYEEIIEVIKKWKLLTDIENDYFSHHGDHVTIFEREEN